MSSFLILLYDYLFTASGGSEGSDAVNGEGGHRDGDGDGDGDEAEKEETDEEGEGEGDEESVLGKRKITSRVDKEEIDIDDE